MRKRRASRISFDDNVPNAMLGVSNLADVMLVLAVGIMLALVLNWHINVGGNGAAQGAPDQMQEVVVSDPDTDIGSSTDLENNPDLEMRGTVYADRNTGKLYMIDSDH